MTEMEVLQRAKRYMDQLAQGVDPISGQEMPDDTILNQARLTRCFFYVSNILGQVIDNGGKVASYYAKDDKPSFRITPDQIAQVPVSAEPIRISQFVELLYTAAGNPDQKKPSATMFTNWLLSKGFLTVMANAEGKQYRAPTEAGVNIGLSSEWRDGISGRYLAISYHDGAQRFLLDHIHEILKL